MAPRLESVVNVVTLTTCVAVCVMLVKLWPQARPARSNPRVAVSDINGGLETSVSSNIKLQQHSTTALIEFSDFQCPFCGKYARETYQAIQRDFIDTGKIEYIFRHFPLTSIHPLAYKAAEAAQCAGEQGRFWPFYERLFANQTALEPDDLVVHADRIGLDTDRFRACLAAGMTEHLKADMDEGARLGVKSTPVFLLGTIQPDRKTIKLTRRINGAQQYATFKVELDRALKNMVTRVE